MSTGDSDLVLEAFKNDLLHFKNLQVDVCGEKRTKREMQWN